MLNYNYLGDTLAVCGFCVSSVNCKVNEKQGQIRISGQKRCSLWIKRTTLVHFSCGGYTYTHTHTHTHTST